MSDHKMIIAGLTGGIGCGKSTISKVFITYNIPVIDADMVSRDVVKPHSLGLVQIIDTFGLSYLQTDGTLNRAALGYRVFSDPSAMEQLNIIMAPLIRAEAEHQFNLLRENGHKLCVYDGALLIESHQAHKYRPLIVAHCSPEQQVERLINRGLTQEQAMNRLQAQMPTAHKLQLADFAIDTGGTKKDSIIQTEIIINYLRKLLYLNKENRS